LSYIGLLIAPGAKLQTPTIVFDLRDAQGVDVDILAREIVRTDSALQLATNPVCAIPRDDERANCLWPS